MKTTTFLRTVFLAIVGIVLQGKSNLKGLLNKEYALSGVYKDVAYKQKKRP